MSQTTIFRPDILGPDYEQATIDLGKDPDTGKAVQAVVVKAIAGNKKADPKKPALLWIHGMSDYFFQTHVAEYFTELGYPFYAVDLRRSGRSRKAGQRWHYTRDVANYYPELNATLDIITDEVASQKVIPVAHSTGGLIAPLWLDYLRRENPKRHAHIAGLILNSPWLDLQYHPVFVTLARPVMNTVGRFLPLLPLPQDNLGTYGESIHHSKHGEWHFDTAMKPVYGHRKYFGWIRAINKAQQQIHAGNIDTGVPTLTLVSAHSYLGKDYSAAADTADTVLDVEQIRKWAPNLSSASTTKTIEGARHDVFLSESFAREVAFKTTAEWLETL
ncbi:alpha/beta hydrolase [Corynebacterium riegelii]|uniref:alpha/beta hydrolase n=1 Tax=Corynebacterium riegelii TaxID=156976 RepID=UPI00288BDCE6|nr:alpha/beta hydrolase [Corynebacterium riegelii]